MINPSDITQKTFDKAIGFGYRMDDVDQYLKEAAESMCVLMEENQILQKKLEVLADKLTEYREDEESLRTAILSAQKLGDSLIRESKTKAEIIMRDATVKADAMLSNAQRQIDREHYALESLQREVANFKNRLLALYRQHFDIITALPGDADETSAPKTGEKASKEEPAPAAKTPEPELEYEKPTQDEIVFESTNELNDEDTLSLFNNMSDEEDDREISIDSPRDSRDDEDEDDEDMSFFKNVTSPSNVNKEKDIRFGEPFKIKRDSNFLKFGK